MAAADPAASGAPVARMTIGQVLDLLRSDFPGITIPKIRFLEAEGLIKPERTAAGYRKFSDGDVERLRVVLRLQRDQYLPLKVIREHLDALDAGHEPPPLDSGIPTVPTVALAGDGLPSADTFGQRSDVRVSRRELLKIVGITEEQLTELEGFGLLTGRPGTGDFDGDDLVVARTARDLADYGLEPRHLRAFRTAADREISLVQQVVAPVARGRDASARGRAEAQAAEMAALAVRLHASLVRAGLRRP